MKARKLIIAMLTVLIAAGLLVGVVLADDSVMHRRNISKTPEQESEKAGIGFMNFTIPAQGSDGTLLEAVEYTIDDGSDEGAIVYTTTTAKPLVAVYIDDLPHEELASLDSPMSINATTSGLSIGQHDTFVAHSLDDGSTWKSVNVSRAADLSSFKLATGVDYPGDSYAAVVATAGNRVMAAWLSRYCDGGSPLYTLVSDPDTDDLTDYYTYLHDTLGLPDLYLKDIWGVTGTQKSVDYTLQGFPEVGEIPYGCVWTARGTLVDTVTDAGTIHDIAWTKAERLTSGVRDPNRLELDCVKGAGCVITWQEDPEGLRPGQGLGPGEGWSGAVVNAKTDIWYSYIGWENFNLVDENGDYLTIEDAAMPIEEYVELYPDGAQPKPTVPMAMPVRLTDNNMCKFADNLNTSGDDYCHAIVDSVLGTVEYPAAEGTAPLCITSYVWDTPDDNTTSTVTVCEAEDGRRLNGRVGASRPRLSLQPYDSDGDGATDSAWFIMAYEESKALGEFVDDEDEPMEIGKNIWYHSFEMDKPEVVQQGGMLNQPSAFNPETGEAADPGQFLTLPEGDEFGYTVYQTEIARRFSFMAQGINALYDETADDYSGTTAFLLYKQGILNQGGPADIFARRIVLPDDFDPLVDNPYEYANMACDNWIIPADGTSAEPNYLEGLCGAPATNLSATTNDICYTTASVLGSDPSQECVDDFPWDGSVEDQFPKVSEWDQFEDNLDDQSWENPFDVAKGHRGFIDGDFIMVLYAWSPNWKANSVGNDKYNLYVRRSFDGGESWTTTPAELGGAGISDSVADPSLCENWGIGGQEEDITTVCYTYAAGEFERARNVSQLTGTKVTILDPRYSPTGGLKKLIVEPYVDDYLDTNAYTIESYDLTRDPSKYFLVYETGDNTTAAEGEPTPMDLFYSRATVYGDIYEWEDYLNDDSTELRWPWLEKQLEDLSGEAAMLANPSGDFMHVNWNQWREDEYENVFDSDIWYRRLFYNIWETAAPSVSVLSAIPTRIAEDEELTLIATAKDNDRLGDGDEIVEFEWTVDGVVVGNQQTYNVPPRTLSRGWHGFSVRAKDNEGHWSRPVSFNIYVGLDYTVHIPVIFKP